MDIVERMIGTVGHAFAFRPGVMIPDWTLVTEPMTREALALDPGGSPGRVGKDR